MKLKLILEVFLQMKKYKVCKTVSKTYIYRFAKKNAHLKKNKEIKNNSTNIDYNSARFKK